MKKYLLILCLVSTVSLVGCATTQANTTNTNTKKTDIKQTRGTYFGTGVGIGVMSF
ncbi:MAG: hypothetical protein K0U37_06320 [Gammaproteobacteria bacterium]|nr:hypothetical protein [Gammaproteobacteria bacterium]